MIDYKKENRITITKGDTIAWKIKFKNITEDLRSAYFTVKENPSDNALIQKSLGAGIAKIDDRAYKNEKTYKLQLQAEDTLPLSADMQYLFDIKVAVGNVVKTILSGILVAKESITSPTQIIIEDAEIEATDLIEAEMETTPATAGIEYEQDPVANAKIGDLTALITTAKQTLVDAINEAKTQANNTQEDVEKILDGTLVVPEATNAVNAQEATHATSADSATTATHATSADEATKTMSALTFGSKTFDGSSDKTLLISDLINKNNFDTSATIFEEGKIGIVYIIDYDASASQTIVINLGVVYRPDTKVVYLPQIHGKYYRINSNGKLGISTDGSSWSELSGLRVLYLN